MAKIEVLGAFGTKGDDKETTCIKLNNTNVIDAGNLLRGFKEECAQIDTVWLTHSHLDHISDIAFVLDLYFEKRTKPLKVAGLKETIKILQKHFLNELIWPDFSNIPLLHGEQMSLEYHVIEIGQRYKIGDGEYIEPFKTNHTVPSCGYIVTKEEQSIAITADTYLASDVWQKVNSRKDIQSVLIECSFPSSLEGLAKESKHLTPKLLEEDLKALNKEVKLYINHIKPNYLETIDKELKAIDTLADAVIIEDYDVIEF